VNPRSRVSLTADPRQSELPAVAALVGGLGLFLLDSASNPRPGPLAYLLVPTPVALLLYVRLRPATEPHRLVALAVWGFVGTTVAGLVTVLVAMGTRLPRPYEAWEFFVLDLGVFLWFVLALSAAFVAAARTHGPRAVVALAAGPVAQFSGFLLTVALTAEDVVLVASVPAF
jgi:hypothetical protein